MAPTLPVVTSLDGPRITVNDLVKDPLRIPQLIIDMTAQGFIADSVLRNAGQTESGAVRYEASTPPYADNSPQVRGEFGEVQIAQTSIGTPMVAYAEEYALGIMVSDRMRRRQLVDPVTRQLMQVKNTLVKTFADTFLNLMISGAGTTIVDGTNWSYGASAVAVRHDINRARKSIATAKTPGGALFGYKADTMIVGETIAYDLLDSDDFNKPYQGNIADESLKYTGLMPNKILGLDVLVTPEMDSVAPNKFIVCQRNTCGFISDEMPMQATALYRVEEKKSWRSDVQRASAMGLDQPLSVTVVNLAGS